MRAEREVREFLERGACRRGCDEALVADAHVAEVVRVELEGGDARVDAVQGVELGGLGYAAPGKAEAVHQAVPREDLRVTLAHVGQHAVDVVLEHGVRREQEHVVGAQVVALRVEQVGDALQQHRRLARAGDAVDEQHGHVLVADYLVLFFLDRGRDGLEARVAALRE